MECFVAMAFGHADSDEIYSKHFSPLLKKYGLTPIMMDDYQHEEDLNIAILDKIRSADIVVADLTYERPSVYYEAGYAERTGNVLYTVRKDHLPNEKPNTDGKKYKVHFDLTMKKIITWSDEKDKTFDSRFEKRLAYLLKPIKRKKEIDNNLVKGRHEFHSLSVNDRCNKIIEFFSTHLTTNGFDLFELYPLSHYLDQQIRPAFCLIGMKYSGKKCITCAVIAAESINKKKIELIIENIQGSTFVNEQELEIKEYQDFYFLSSLKKIPPSFITNLFPYAKPKRDSCEFSILKKTLYKHKKRSITIRLLSPVDSELDISDKFKVCGKLINSRISAYSGKLINDTWWGSPRIIFQKR